MRVGFSNALTMDSCAAMGEFTMIATIPSQSLSSAKADGTLCVTSTTRYSRPSAKHGRKAVGRKPETAPAVCLSQGAYSERSFGNTNRPQAKGDEMSRALLSATINHSTEPRRIRIECRKDRDAYRWYGPSADGTEMIDAEVSTPAADGLDGAKAAARAAWGASAWGLRATWLG